MLQRVDLAFEDHLSPPEQLDPAATADLAFHHAATGNDAQPRDLDGNEYLHAAFADLAESRLTQALGGTLHVFGQLVDDVVVAHLDLGPFRCRGCGRRGLEVEADDDRVGDTGQQQVRVADGADALADDLDGDHRIFDFLERAEESLESALRVGLDHQAELFDLAFLGAARELFEGDARGDVPRGFRGAALRQLRERDLAGGLFRADDLEDVPGLWNLAHTGHHHRRRGRRIGHALAAVVGEGSHAPVDVAAHKVVTDTQRAGLNEHGRDGAASSLEVRVDHGPEGVSVWVGFELEDVRRQDDRRQQVVDALAGPRAEVNALDLAAVVARDDALRRELLVDAIDVGVLLVDLVDRDDDRNLCRACVVYGLDRLRHHSVVGRDNQHRDVRD